MIGRPFGAPGRPFGAAERPGTFWSRPVALRFNVWLTRPGAAQKFLGLSLGRHYEVAEPLPGTAEIWSFVVQYQYQNAPFGQMSQPVTITVRG